MNIQKISSAKNFGHIIIANKEYEKILKPYKDELDKLTKGYDVYINTEPPHYLYDRFLEDGSFSFDLPSVTITPYDSDNRTIPEMKFVVNPGAGEMQTEDGKAQEMIRVIKKALSLYK